MVTIKVAYADESRRFVISRDSTWSELESQLRTLFKVPDTLRIVASYIDEDGDNITLSSDLELQEVIYQASEGVPIKLILTTFSTDVDETAAAIEQLKIRDSTRVHFARREPENTETETETETERDTGGCGRSCRDFGYHSTEEEQNSSDPEIYFIVTDPRRSRRGPKFGYAKFDPYEGSGRCPFVRDEFRSRHGGPFQGGPFQGGPFYGGPFRGGPFHGGPFHGGPFHGDHRAHVKEFGPHGHHKFGKQDHVRGHGHGYGHVHDRDHGNFHGHGHGHKFGRHCHGRKHRREPLTPEELAEKVELLNSMGFPPENNAHYEELLKKFGGRIGHVVEVLLCERKRKDGEKDKEPKDDDDNGETSTTSYMEVIENKEIS